MQHLTRNQLNEWIESKIDFVLVDVREADEHHAQNIGGYLVPLSTIKVGFPLFDTDLPVVVYCKRGIRSQIAIQRLRSQFPTTNFYNLRDGIHRVDKG